MNSSAVIKAEKHWGHIDPVTKQPVGVWGQLALRHADMGGTYLLYFRNLTYLDCPL